MATPRLLLASCRDLPGWEVDDRPLHSALRARGAEIVVAPWDDPSLELDLFDGILVRTTWDYHHHRERFLSWVDRASSLSRLFNPAPILRWNTDKRYLRSLAELGIPLPTTIWIEPGESPDLASLLDLHGWQRGFLKPVVGANAIRTLRFSRQETDSAHAFLTEALRFGPMMLQPYLEKVETSGEFSGIWINGRYAHGVQKIPRPGDWRVQDDHGASDQPYSLTSDELALGENILRHTHTLCPTDGPLLYARVDFLRDADGGPKLMELELVEPSLFFRHGPTTAVLLANALLERLGS